MRVFLKLSISSDVGSTSNLEKGYPVFKEHKHMLRSSLINFFMSMLVNHGLLNFFRVAAQ